MLDAATQRAKELLATTRNAAMATVNKDGSPHNTPIHYIIDPNVEHLYWVSSPEAIHSQNIVRSHQAFVVIYEAAQNGGLYLEVADCHETSDQERTAGLEVWNLERKKEGRAVVGPDLVNGAVSQRMYTGSVRRAWVNHSERNAEGNIVRDMRREIKPDKLR